MAIVLSLLSAAIFGTGDFCGGLSAKRASIIHVVAGSHLVGLVGVTAASLVLAESFLWDDFALGAAGGAFGGIGVAFLYRRLAVGPMSIVAPLTAITSAAVPSVWGIATGDTFGTLAWIGLALAFVAIGLVSGSDDGADARVTTQVVAESLLAGVGFGLFFIFVDATSAESAPWPIAGARLLTSAALLSFMVGSRRQIVPRARGALALIALTGIFDTASNVLFLYATDRGSLTLVAVLTSLYPLSTVVLARFVLGERMTRTQQAGFVSAMVATVLIASG